ncbi:MAG: pyridoxine 5'-phosphate synthase [Pseudomonadota bacterium]|nr:pyridoxine 5'-phosphate synthase [Pseudomonadota bacterium]
MLLGVNIDHIATLREVRGTAYPNLLDAAKIAEAAGADSITIHLREDRRHIQDRDVIMLLPELLTRMNLEMAVTEEMINIACQLAPSDCCLVPEKRAELTTEGGLNVKLNQKPIASACDKLNAAGIRVSLFIDPETDQIDAAQSVGAEVIELHTGNYADAVEPKVREKELSRIKIAAEYANNLGLLVHAGHGLHYDNVSEVASIQEIIELNIGHSIVARAVFSGLGDAVRDMKHLIINAGKI